MMFFSCHLQSLMLEGKKEQTKVTSCGHSTPPADPKFPARHSANTSGQQPIGRVAEKHFLGAAGQDQQ